MHFLGLNEKDVISSNDFQFSFHIGLLSEFKYPSVRLGLFECTVHCSVSVSVCDGTRPLASCVTAFCYAAFL